MSYFSARSTQLFKLTLLSLPLLLAACSNSGSAPSAPGAEAAHSSAVTQMATTGAVQVDATRGTSAGTNGSYVTLLSNGASARITVPAGVSGSYKLQLQAKGDVFQGEPVVEVRRGTTVLGKVTIGAEAKLYDVGALSVQPGDVLNVVFINDYATGPWPKDRNALIDYGLFTSLATLPVSGTGTTPITTPVHTAPTPAGLAPANSNATADARKVLSWLSGLKNRTSNKALSGQSIAHSNGWEATDGYQRYVEGLKSVTGKYPAFIESGYTLNQAGVNAVLLKQWQAGGLVGVQMHFDNPFTGGSSWVNDSWAPKPDLTALLTTAPASGAKTRWFTMLDSVASGLKELQDKGVVVMFRPLHEMNGAHFWWGLDRNRDNSAGYKALWRDMFTYLTKTKGLNNLLWTYGTSVSWDAPVLRYYPGPDYVDVVGFDHYEDNLAVYHSWDYTDLQTTGKPIWLHEVGPSTLRDGNWNALTIIDRIKTSHPDMMAFTSWHSWSGAKVALTDIQNTAALLNDSWVITRDEVNWR